MKHTIVTTLLPPLVIGSAMTLLTACSSPGSHYWPMPASLAQEPYASTRAIAGGENYTHLNENERIRVSQEPISTFSIDVDTASYANVRRFLNGGHLPPVDAVRTEEMVNYFDYAYPHPSSMEEPFNVTTELGNAPWSSNSYLLHIGIKAYEPPQQQQPPRNLVFLLDVSGSMGADNKLELVKKSLRLLVKQLDADDSVAIVVYAGASGVVLPPTAGDHSAEIIAALERLHAGGSTNGGAGIELAYRLAERHLIKDGVNRVILATDGDFNVGPSSVEDLKQLIRIKKRSGIGLTVLGMGMYNYNDAMLEEISNAGDGNAAYIDTLNEAQKILVNDIQATLHTVAKDTKIQVEFNPQHVASYRLVGYENRLLETEDFANDRVDAGDVGAGHTVTAIYEITPAQPHRYQREDGNPGIHSRELATVKLRYKRPSEQSSRELVHHVEAGVIDGDLKSASPTFRFSAAVAGFAQLLRGSKYVEGYNYEEVYSLAQGSRGEDRYGYRSEFMQLVKLAQSLE